MRDAVTTALKVRENRARRVLGRMGHRLEKSPRRDPRAADFGLYRIAPVAGPRPTDDAFGMTLADVETWMEGAPAARPRARERAAAPRCTSATAGPCSAACRGTASTPA